MRPMVGRLHSIPRPLGLASQFYLFLLTVVPIATTLALLPLCPCPRNCGPARQLVEHTRLPGITPVQGAKMLSWGNSLPCSLCDRTRRVSLIRWVVRSTTTYSGYCG